MKDLLEHLFRNETITSEQAKQALLEIVSEKHNEAIVASFLTVFRMRAVTVDELEGFREGLYELCTKIDLSQYAPIDMCGTGGDGKDTFNISTLASFVAAGAGVKVAKHGNYGVSSGCGSSHVLEALGIRFVSDEAILQKQIDKAGICYLHAPLFHPAMKSVAPVRKALGIRTIFNLLGPLANPAGVKKQLVGVFSLEIARLYSALLARHMDSYAVVYSLDGYDELSLTDQAKLYRQSGEDIVDAKDFGIARVTSPDLQGGSTPKEGAEIFQRILDGNGTEAQQRVVCANAALAINVANPASTLPDCYAQAQDSLCSGKALQALKVMREIAS